MEEQVELRGSRTEANLREALAREAQAYQRLQYFARLADLDGHAEAAMLLRGIADGETGHALGTIELLSEIGDPQGGGPVGPTRENLQAVLAGEREEATDLYPGFAAIAREEHLAEAADWFDALAAADRRHAEAVDEALQRLGPV